MLPAPAPPLGGGGGGTLRPDAEGGGGGTEREGVLATGLSRPLAEVGVRPYTLLTAEFGASTVVELGVEGGRVRDGGGGTARPEEDGAELGGGGTERAGRCGAAGGGGGECTVVERVGGGGTALVMVEGVGVAGGGGAARPGPACGTVLEGGGGTALEIVDGGPDGGGSGGASETGEDTDVGALETPLLGIWGGLARLVVFAVERGISTRTFAVQTECVR
jgi:hypothetical protein